MATTASFRGRRREIASLVSDTPRTLYEIAKAMGTPSGSIYRLVHAMVDEGILDADPFPPSRGTLYSLAPVHRERLDEALPDDRSTGRLTRDQRVMVVGGLRVTDLYRVLGRPSVASPLAWLVELDSGGTLLLGLHADATKIQSDRLASALEKLGGTLTTGRVGDILAGDEVRRVASSMDELTSVP